MPSFEMVLFYVLKPLPFLDYLYLYMRYGVTLVWLCWFSFCSPIFLQVMYLNFGLLRGELWERIYNWCFIFCIKRYEFDAEYMSPSTFWLSLCSQCTQLQLDFQTFVWISWHTQYNYLLFFLDLLSVNVYVPKDRVTNLHQGYGFVEFRSEEDADYVSIFSGIFSIDNCSISSNIISSVN